MSEEPPAKIFKVGLPDFRNDSSEIELMEVEDDELASSSRSSILASEKPALDILNHKFLQVESRFVADIRSFTAIPDYDKLKIIKITLECNLALQKLSILNSEAFPNVFIFVIELKSLRYNQASVLNIESLMNNLFITDYHATRPLILQLTSKSENLSRFFYKKEKSNNFAEIGIDENVDNIWNFSSFFWKFMNGEIDSFDRNLIVNLLKLQRLESNLIIRFLNIFKIPGDFLWTLKIECTKYGSKSQFLAAFDESFDNKTNHLNIKGQSILNRTFLLSTSEVSILSLAVENSNIEIIEYLTTKCFHLIQQLPSDHQVRVTTIAFNNQEFDILSELIEECDFPFPDKFSIGLTSNLRFNHIAKSRCDFFIAIQFGNLTAINNFIDNNPNLKIVYSIDNKSSLKQSIDSNKIDIYCVLKFHGFQPAYNEDFENFLTPSQREQIAEINVQNGLKCTTAVQLAHRSIIHNQKINKETEQQYRQFIQKWYELIYKSKFGMELINAIAQCEELIIDFDFESEFVHNIDMSPKDEAFGSTYPHKKWILIGAKLTNDENKEQEIRGTIAHEFCHYILYLIFDNNLKPYSNKSKNIEGIFDAIVKVYSQWFHSAFTNSENEAYDECNHIISNVYKKYSMDKHHQELIVRVPEHLCCLP